MKATTAKKPRKKAARKAPKTAAKNAPRKQAPKGEWAKNYTELAEVLGVTRQTLNNWKALPGAPKPASNSNHDVEAWRRFREEHDLKGSEIPEEKRLKLSKERIELEQKAFKLERDRGLYVRRELYEKRTRELIGELFQELSRRFEHSLPPQYRGKTPAECSALNRQQLEELKNFLSNRIEE